MSQVQILTTKEIQIKNTYLVDFEGKPVTNVDFAEAQLLAYELQVRLETAKEIGFTNKKQALTPSVACLNDAIMRKLENSIRTEFVSSPEKPARELSDKMKAEALDFIKYQEEKSNIDNLNESLEIFKPIYDCENIGLPFESGVTTLPKLFTMDEVIKMMTEFNNL